MITRGLLGNTAKASGRAPVGAAPLSSNGRKKLDTHEPGLETLTTLTK